MTGLLQHVILFSRLSSSPNPAFFLSTRSCRDLKPKNIVLAVWWERGNEQIKTQCVIEYDKATQIGEGDPAVSRDMHGDSI